MQLNTKTTKIQCSTTLEVNFKRSHLFDISSHVPCHVERFEVKNSD